VSAAAGVGFEPTARREPGSGFQDRPVRPLRHPASSHCRNSGSASVGLGTLVAMAEQSRSFDEIDDPIERLRLIGDDENAVASYLDTLEVRGPRERELLRELARSQPLAGPELFPVAHRRVVAALESLARHGYHSTGAGKRLGPLRPVVRFLVELVARYLVVSHLRQVSTDLRNLYWAREMQSRPFTEVRRELRRARMDAEGLLVILERRTIGLPSFVFGGVLISGVATAWRGAAGFAFGSWVAALVSGLVTVLVVVGAAWVILRGAALASRRIRVSTHAAVERLWETIGHCGRPPKDQSAKFATVAIVLTIGVWIVLPIAVALAFA
jgi:hypothetical protein